MYPSTSISFSNINQNYNQLQINLLPTFLSNFLAVAFVHANSTIRYGWTPGTESVFRFESQVLTGIPDIRNSQFSGMKLHAQVRVQAFPDYTLRVKLEQPKFITLFDQNNLQHNIPKVTARLGNMRFLL